MTPGGWTKMKIGDVAVIQRGASPRPITDPRWFDESSEVGWIRISDVTRSNGRYLCDTTDHLSAAGIANSRWLPTGTVIMSICATVGIPVITDIDACIHDGFVSFQDLSGVSPRFLLYKLKQLEPHFRSLGQTGSQRNLNSDLVRECIIELPASLAEQEAIAEALGDADAAIEALDALIAKKRDVKQAAMQQLLTGRTRLPEFTEHWREVEVGDVALVDPEALGASTPVDYAFRYISLENTSQGRLLGWTDERFGTAPSRARRVLRSGDFLFATVRPNLLGHHLFRQPEQDWVCSTGFAVLRSKPGVCAAPFLSQLFFAHEITSQIELLISGSNYPAISSRDVARLRIWMPGLDEQEAIAEVLSDMDAEIEALVAQREKMRLVKQGMMQELLSGRVRLV